MSQEDKSDHVDTRFKFGNKTASKYRDSYVDEMYKYFNREPVTVDEVTEYNDAGQVIGREKIITPVDYPTFEGFAAKIGVDRDTLLNWCVDHPRFRHCYAWAREKQRDILIVNGMAGRYSANFAKFIAINCHGMQDKIVNENVAPIRVQLAPEADEEAN